MSVYTGNNLAEWVQHFQLSEECHAFLMFLGAASCEDLQFIYDDVQVLEDLKSNISPVDYAKFLQVKSLTSILSTQQPLNLPIPPTTSTTNAPTATTNLAPPPAPVASTTDFSIDVKNLSNSVARWTSALNIYQQESAEARSQRTPEKIVINALIDISGSMEGKKLIAVKLGLCALISHLQDNDVMNITTFSDGNRTITNGFQAIGQLKMIFPQLLSNIRDDGSTAFFDTVIAGICHLRSYSTALPQDTTLNQQELAKKSIVIALTDGEDNASRHSSAMVFYRLTNPGINHFMFILVAVDMRQLEEDTFKTWMELRHCKQMSVNIHTGNKLVSIFREILVHRVLLTDVNHTRFYQILPTAPLPLPNHDSENNHSELIGRVEQAASSSAPDVDFDAEDSELIHLFDHRGVTQSFPVLRQGLLRQHNALHGSSGAGEGGYGLDDENAFDCYSPAISRCNSVSDFGDSNNHNHSNGFSRHRINYDDADSDSYNSDMAPPYYSSRDSSPSYIPSPPYDSSSASPTYNPSAPIYAPHSPVYQSTLPTFSSTSPLTDDLNRPSQIRRLSFSPSTLLVQQNSVEPLANGVGRVLIVDEIDNEGRLFRTKDTIATIPEQKEEEEEEEGLLTLPKDCYCPIMHKVMRDPVICADGHTYERRAIEEWFRQGHPTSPLTNLPLPSQMLLPNHSLKNLITTLKVNALEEKRKKKQAEDVK